jgi:phage repressor protein C with HTH and peptisase S24 domain
VDTRPKAGHDDEGNAAPRGAEKDERMDVIAWIRRGLARPEKSQRGLAKALGIDPAGVTRLLAGERQLKASEIAKVARYLGLEPPPAVGGRGLEPPPAVGGRGAEPSPRALAPAASNDGAITIDGDDYARVALYDARAAAGAGGVGRDLVTHRLLFRQQWLRSVTSAPIEELAVLEIDGDSMEPTLRSGDHALIDRSECMPRRKDGLYVLRAGDGLQVKRVSAHPVTGLLTIASDNPAYKSYGDIRPADVEIIGRVIWIGRRM